MKRKIVISSIVALVIASLLAPADMILELMLGVAAALLYAALL